MPTTGDPLKFLTDRCVGLRLADWLREQGHDVVSAASLGPDPGDPALLKLAADEGRVAVTFDKDFPRHIYADRMRHAGLVLLPSVPVPERIRLMGLVLGQHADDLRAQAVITVRGSRVRVARR